WRNSGFALNRASSSDCGCPSNMEASFSTKANAPGVGTGRSGIIEQGDRHQHLRDTGPDTTSGGALPRLVQLNHFVAALGQPGNPDRNDRSLWVSDPTPPIRGRQAYGARC